MPHISPAEGPRAGQPAHAPETPAPPNAIPEAIPEAIPISPGTPPEAVPRRRSRLLVGGAVALSALAVATLVGVACVLTSGAHPQRGLVVAALSAEEVPAEPELLPPPAAEPDAGRAGEAPPGDARPGHPALDKPRLAPAELLTWEAPRRVAAVPVFEPSAPPAPRAPTEDDLRAQIARMPEVGLSPPELKPLVQGWADAFAATFNDTTNRPSFEPTPILNQHPDFAQLPLRHGRASRLTPREADRLQKLSKRLQSYLANRSAQTCGGCHTTLLALDFKRMGGHDRDETPVDLAPLRKALREDKDGRQPAWRRPEAIPTLQQVLTPEPAPVRGLYVELLSEIEGRRASVALAQRAVFDLSPEVRRRAVEALRKRPRHEYRQVLLDALRYPWAPAAEHGAKALLDLKDKEAVPVLVGLLKEPSPTAPFKLPNGKHVVREVVRLRHAFNCLTCHPPASSNNQPVPGAVPGINLTRVIPRSEPVAQVVTTATRAPGFSPVPAPLRPGLPPPLILPPPPPPPPPQPPGGGGGGQHVPCPVAGGGSSSTPGGVSVSTAGGAAPAAPPPFFLVNLVRGPDRVQLRQTLVIGQRPLPPLVVKQPVFVRGDITFLRQDFSVQLPMAGPATGVPAMVRFDFVVRNRPVTPTEVKRLEEKVVGREGYPQRGAVLNALRGLTGRHLGDSTLAWEQLYPHAEAQARVWKLSEELADAPEGRREAVLARFQVAKGAEYDEALASSVERLPSAWRERARGGLAARLTRMDADGLREKLRQGDAETRRAAARAALRKKEKSLAPDLVSLLEGGDSGVAREARLALEGLSGRKFPTAAGWREWASVEVAGKDAGGGE